jgi:hypothetical protein
MEERSCFETDSRSAAQEILHLLRNQKIHYHVKRARHVDHVVSQLKPGHVHIIYSSKIHFNTVFASVPKFCIWFLTYSTAQFSSLLYRWKTDGAALKFGKHVFIKAHVTIFHSSVELIQFR